MMDKTIFVFGSNLAGVHGAGAAAHAMEHKGAKWGQGFGPQGLSFAIPTKDWSIKTLPLYRIAPFIHEFILYAMAHPHIKFFLTPIGCGLAGYKPKDIAPYFKFVPENVMLPPEFEEVL
jgi:hypothetical protein